MTQAAPAKVITQVQRTDEQQEPHTRPLSLRLIVRLLGFTGKYAYWRNWLTFCVILRAIQLPLLAVLIGWVLRGPIANAAEAARQDNDAAVRQFLWGLPGQPRPAGFEKAEPWTFFDSTGTVWAILTFAVLALITQFTLHFRQRLAMQLGESVIHDLRNEMFAHLQRQPMAFFDRTKVGRIISRFASDAENVRVGVQEVLFVSIVNGGQMIVATVLMFLIDRFLSVLVLGVGLVVWVLNRLFRETFARSHRAAQESMSRVTATLAESVSGVRVTQGFVRQDVNAELFHDLVDDHAGYNMAVQRASGLFNPLLELNTQFFLAALLVVGGFRVLQGGEGVTTSAGDLISFFFLANVFFAPVQAMGTQYTQALTAMASAERVFSLLDTQPDWTDAPDAIDLPPIEGTVEFQDLCFEYVKDRPVLHDINFKAVPGQTIALVGHTGSGKSSIINLISKFYLPTSGRLLIDGYDITTITSKSLHEQMGIVLQVNFLFSGTVMDNIRIGKPGATDAQVRDAAARLDCLDLIEALPEGFYTDVGEGGSALSLGQRQLVCFTRAMLADPRILILDEATSSVDTMTEARIQKSLEVLFQGRTTFVVAHRLSTIRHADCVLVLDHGHIVERGSHTDLLTTGGVYANLYRQFIHASEA